MSLYSASTNARQLSRQQASRSVSNAQVLSGVGVPWRNRATMFCNCDASPNSMRSTFAESGVALSRLEKVEFNTGVLSCGGRVVMNLLSQERPLSFNTDLPSYQRYQHLKLRILDVFQGMEHRHPM